MRKIVSYIICIAILLSFSVAFTSCGDKSNEQDTTEPVVETIATTTTAASDDTTAEEEVETVYVVVTNANGEKVTDSEGKDVTEKVTVTKKKASKTKKTTTKTAPTYEVKGGTDPYVEDIF